MGSVDQTPIESPIQDYLEQLHPQYAGLQDGEVASYIPELAKADRNWFGICIATTDGHVYEVGDSRQAFTIQSISKPFVYGLALEDNGEKGVLDKVGVEPTGDAFNSISLNPQSGCPLNPMINAGAIAVTGLVQGKNAVDKSHRILHAFSRFTGHEVVIDNAVYQSEKETGHRNRAIGHMLRNFDVITTEPEPVLDLYFQQCSISVDCRDLAVMAASLANGGSNPITRQRALRQEYVESILSVMASCGMYDYAGEWVYRVGMPAKSGVSGGILAVLPGQLGIGVFSPPLDIHGNSVRGIRVCHTISKDFNLHLFNVPRFSKAVIRSKYGAAQINSRRLRGEEEVDLLRKFGDRIHIYELQGELTFTSTEIVVRDMGKSLDSMEFAILDMKRVVTIDDAARKLFLDLARSMAAKNIQVIFSNVENEVLFSKYLKEECSVAGQPSFLIFGDNDLALEWCENRLIAQWMPPRASQDIVPLAGHEMCQGLTKQELNRLQRYLKLMTFAAGEVIIKSGDAPDNIYSLAKGEVSVTISLPTGKLKRLSTLSPGMMFGEMAIVDRAPRSADVRADTDVECYALSCEDFDRLGQLDGNLRATLLNNLLRHMSRMLRRLSREVSTLAQ